MRNAVRVQEIEGLFGINSLGRPDKIGKNLGYLFKEIQEIFRSSKPGNRKGLAGYRAT
jgi:hypothetical protein